MNQQRQARGIVLGRIDYGEADRILTMLTPDQGKLRLMAKGVRRAKSKLAGGIELFSVSEISYIPGRGEIGTVVSTRLEKYYGKIVADINRTLAGYEIIKQLARNTEDNPEAEYFELLQIAFASLDQPDIEIDLIITWFWAQLLRLAGHTPNLRSDGLGQPFENGNRYLFDFESMSFSPNAEASFSGNHIKMLRLLFSSTPPQVIQKVQAVSQLINEVAPLINSLKQTQLRV